VHVYAGGNNQTETAKSERSKLAQMYKRKNSEKFYRSASTFRGAVPHENGTNATALVFGTHLKANIRQYASWCFLLIVGLFHSRT